MADPVEIPVTSSDPLYTMRTTLDSREYVLRLDYSQREDRWFLSVETTDGRALVKGIKVVSNWPLLRKYSNAELPPGRLMAIDFSPQGGSPPGGSDFGTRVKLLYFPA